MNHKFVSHKPHTGLAREEFQEAALRAQWRQCSRWTRRGLLVGGLMLCGLFSLEVAMALQLGWVMEVIGRMAHHPTWQAFVEWEPTQRLALQTGAASLSSTNLVQMDNVLLHQFLVLLQVFAWAAFCVLVCGFEFLRQRRFAQRSQDKAQ